MSDMNRRMFLMRTAAASAAGSAARLAPPVAVALKSRPAKRVLELVYDKSLGMMRAVDRVVN